MSEGEHVSNLSKLCRICGEFLSKDSYIALSHADSIYTVFFVKVKEDSGKIHPPKLCQKCYQTHKNVIKRSSVANIKIKIWKPHTENDCEICHITLPILKKGGRKPKKVKTGRPVAQMTKWTHKHSTNILKKTPEDNTHCYKLLDFNIEQMALARLCICHICQDIARQPIMITPCEHLFCVTCLMPNLEGKLLTELKCPMCNAVTSEDKINPSEKMRILKLSLKIECGKECGESFTIMMEKEKGLHEKDCNGPSSSPSSSSATISSLFNIKDISEISRDVNDAVLHVIKTKIADSSLPNKSIKFDTSGPRPLFMTSTPVAVKGSAEASTRTVRKRTKFVMNQLELSSGCSTDSVLLQTGQLMKRFDVEGRKSILHQAGIKPVSITAEEMVGMKVDMGIPWEKLKTMARWLKTLNIQPPSQSKQKEIAKEWCGDDLVVEDAPFTFQIKTSKKQYEIRSSPWAYLEDLTFHVYQRLEDLDKNKILIHTQKFDNEIHVKLCGDHGGGSFKMSQQICNTERPNSKTNTIVFSLFEAKDYHTNLKVALERFKNQVDTLQNETWRSMKIRVFIGGDYEFLCKVYGITGASGRHCCLFCLIKSEDMKKPSSQRGNIILRTLSNLDSDLQRFHSLGSDLKKAKDCNNVIHERLFNVPIDQVALPALHISLGTYLKFFNLLESTCRIIDMELAAHLASNNKRISQQEFNDVIDTHKRIQDLDKVICDCEEKIDLVHQAIALNILKDPGKEKEIKKIYEPRIEYLQNKKDEKEEELRALREQHNLNKDAGPCVKMLDKILCSLHVERQAYHGKSFIGNHVHKMLKDNSIVTLCNAIPKLIFDMGLAGTDLHAYSIDVRHKFTLLFKKYANCHMLINGCETFHGEKIKKLEDSISDLMSFYRLTWPNESVTPKLHMLEEHAVGFIKKWGHGFGIYGEQGAESLHAEFNAMHRTYCRMGSSKQRVESMMKEHLTRVHPQAQNLKPVPPKRKFKNNQGS